MKVTKAHLALALIFALGGLSYQLKASATYGQCGGSPGTCDYGIVMGQYTSGDTTYWNCVGDGGSGGQTPCSSNTGYPGTWYVSTCFIDPANPCLGVWNVSCDINGVQQGDNSACDPSSKPDYTCDPMSCGGETCGDGICNSGVGEGCNNCPQDCGSCSGGGGTGVCDNSGPNKCSYGSAFDTYTAGNTDYWICGGDNGQNSGICSYMIPFSANLTSCVSNYCTGAIWGNYTAPQGYFYYPDINQMVSSFPQGSQSSSNPDLNLIPTINGTTYPATKYWKQPSTKDTSSCQNLQSPPPSCSGGSMPPPPTAANVTCGNGGTQATVNWTLPAGSSNANLRVNYNTGTCAWPSNVIETISDPGGGTTGSYTFPVTPGQQNCYWVETNNSSYSQSWSQPYPPANYSGSGPWGATFTCNSSPPPPPTAASVSCGSNGSQATISWTLPAGSTNANVRVNYNRSTCTWPADIAQTVTGSGTTGSYTFPVTPGQPNCFWTETSNSSYDPSYSSPTPSNGMAFTCNACNTAAVGANQLTGCAFSDPGNGTFFNSNIGSAPPGAVASGNADSFSPLPYYDVYGNGGMDGQVNNISSRWKGKFTFTGGNYNFTWGSDDGIRAFIDDNNDNSPDGGSYLFNDWAYQPYPSPLKTAVANIPAGQHQIDVEWMQGGGGAAYSLSWALLPPATGTLFGANWTNTPTAGALGNYYNENSNLTWNTQNVSSCSISGISDISGTNVDATTVPASQLNKSGGGPFTTSAMTSSATYTLNCVGSDGHTYSGLSTLHIIVPPQPAISNSSCPAPGSSSSVTFVPVSGWQYYYVQMFDKSGATPPATPGASSCTDTAGLTDGTCIGGYNSASGLTVTYNTTPGHTYYWVVYTDDGPDHANTGAWSQAATTQGSPVTCTPPPGPPGTGPSHYSCSAGACVDFNTAGSSDCSACGGGDGTATYPVNASCGSATQINLTWQTGSGATGYNIWRNTTNTFGGSKLAGPINPNPLVYADTTAAANTNYYYWVEDSNAPGTYTAANSGAAINTNACGPPPAPTGGTPCNSDTGTSCPIGIGNPPSCQNLVRLTWTDNSTNETGFKIYMDGGASPVATAPPSSPASLSGEILYYDYTAPDNNPHSYAIASTNSNGDSAPVSAGSIAAAPCAVQLGNSNKQILAVDGAAISPAPIACNSGQGSPLPAYLHPKTGDILTFSVNLCNDNGSAPAAGLWVTDRLTNLVQPPDSQGGWSICYSGSYGYSPNCGGGTKIQPDNASPPGQDKYWVSGSIPNQVITINLTKAGRNVPAGGRQYLTFQAQLQPPMAATGSSGRLFQNFANISYTGNASGINVWTPLQQFLNGNNAPIIREQP